MAAESASRPASCMPGSCSALTSTWWLILPCHASAQECGKSRINDCQVGTGSERKAGLPPATPWKVTFTCGQVHEDVVCAQLVSRLARCPLTMGGLHI